MKETKEKVECKHKWAPLGCVVKEVWSGDGSNYNPRKKWDEKTECSIFCKLCGEIKTND